MQTQARAEDNNVNKAVELAMDKLNEILDKREKRRCSVSSACSTLTELSTESYEEMEEEAPKETVQRRLSISSMCSTLTELSTNSYEEVGGEMLIEAGQRRLSISSICSTLSELSTSSEEEFELSGEHMPMDLTPDEPEPTQTSIPIRKVRLTLSNVTNLTAASLPVQPSTPLHPNPPTAAHKSRSDAAVHSKKKGKKGGKAKQAKKPKTAPGPIEEVEHKHSHNRMKGLCKKNKLRKTKKERRTAKLAERALADVEIVDCELDRLQTARATVYERREYKHEELEALGIRTIPWNGRQASPSSRLP